MLHYTILCYTVQYYTILHYSMLYYTVQHYTILHYTILYYTVQYYPIFFTTVCYTRQRADVFFLGGLIARQYLATLSQPAGSVQGWMRVTVQVLYLVCMMM